MLCPWGEYEMDAEEGGSYEAGLQGSLRWLWRPGWDRKQDGRHIITRSEEVLTRR